MDHALLLGGAAPSPAADSMMEEGNNLACIGVAPDAEAGGGGSARPAPAAQAAAVAAEERREVESGAQMYIISKSWWADWCAHTGFSHAQQPAPDAAAPAPPGAAPAPAPPACAAAPGAISNDAVVGLNGDLAPGLSENEQFEIVSAGSWALLHGWYGGGPTIARPAVPGGRAAHNKRARVIIYPLRLEVVWGGAPNEFKDMVADTNVRAPRAAAAACRHRAPPPRPRRAPTPRRRTAPPPRAAAAPRRSQETVRSFKERACAAFGVEPGRAEIWDYFHNGKYANLDLLLDSTMGEVRVVDNQAILLDDKDNPLEAVADAKTGSGGPVIAMGSGRPMFGRANSFALEDSTVHRSDGRPGLVGLVNLGNTCFMNSSLQCLMHSVPLMRVFLSGTYEADLNTANPLGMAGQLATAFGGLMANLWRPEVGTVSPRGFKAKIAQFAPQFSGYQQHDSQEFLAFLLDGLHEDINRIHVKPYIEVTAAATPPDRGGCCGGGGRVCAAARCLRAAAHGRTPPRAGRRAQEPDSEGVPDAELAARAWANYRARNDSHIVDHFQGLYKSTLVCPGCGYSSVKLDPFMYLSLPLPESRVRQVEAILLHADGAAPPREFGLEVPHSGTLRELYAALVRAAGLALERPEEHLVAARLSSSLTSSYALVVHEDARTRVSELQPRSVSPPGALLVYYYADPAAGPAGEGNQKVVVYHRRAGQRRGGGGDDKFSAPLLLWLPPGETYEPGHVARAGLSANGQQEYALCHAAPLWRHVRRMLRPFLAVPALRQRAPPSCGGGGGGGGDGGAACAPAPAQPAGAAGAPDVSMAAASALPGSPDPSPSPDPCCTSRHASGAAPRGAAPPAASEAGDNNSTWGSHGSGSGAASDMDLGGLEDLQPVAPAGGGSPSEGEADPAAALAAAELGGAAAGSATGVLGSGGVPVTPLDLWAAQPAPAAPAAGTPGAGTPGGGTPGGAAWPPYLLKLARDTADCSTSVASWCASHFHPHVHHSTFVLDWQVGCGAAHSAEAYLAAAAAADAERQQQPQQDQQQQQQQQPDQQQLDQQQGGVAQQQQQQPGQQQQQQPGAAGAPPPALQAQGGDDDGQPTPVLAPPGPSADPHFWAPPGPGSGPPGGCAAAAAPGGDVVVVGDYVLGALEQPEFDASLEPIRAARADPRGRSVGLEACVETFLQPEQLSEADEWYCPKCKTHVQAEKKLDLWSLPEVLVVHLKRFSYTRWNRDKLDTQVLFPLEGLDLSRYVLGPQASPPLYDCYAVSNHYGGLGGGHYTAAAQMPDDRRWHCFDDSRVEEISPEAVQSRAAYVLFYRRRTEAAADPPGLVDELLAARAAHVAAKAEAQRQAAADTAAAAAAAPSAAPAPGGAAMETDGPLLLGAPLGGDAGEWGSPSPIRAAAAGRASPVPVGGCAGPGSPVAAGGQGFAPRAARRAGGADTTSTSSSRGPRGGEDDGDSSDGSCSRPRRAPRAAPAGAPWAAAGGSGSDLADEVGLELGELGGEGERGAAMRQSDQGADADMADRDV
ncbi:UBP11 [Scenedesmus sp. PABB004]|nr:UBP11 [Scenedesmus sp. PABB004]